MPMIAALRSRLKASNCSLFDEEFRVDLEKRFRIDGQTGEKLIFVDIDAGEPHRESYFVDARHLRDTVAIRERQWKDKGNRVASNKRLAADASTPAYQAVTTVCSSAKAMTATPTPKSVSRLRSL